MNERFPDMNPCSMLLVKTLAYCQKKKIREKIELKFNFN